MKKLVKKVAMLVAAIAITASSFAPLANAGVGVGEDSVEREGERDPRYKCTYFPGDCVWSLPTAPGCALCDDEDN